MVKVTLTLTPAEFDLLREAVQETKLATLNEIRDDTLGSKEKSEGREKAVRLSYLLEKMK